MIPADTAELRRVLHRVADAAIMADDAIVGDDADALRRAVDIMTAHVATSRTRIGMDADA